MYSVHLCSFTSLDDLPKRLYKDPVAVLKALAQAKRFSVFEATSSMVLAKMLERLLREGLYKNTGGTYPWVNIELTEAGLHMIAEPQESEK